MTNPKDLLMVSLGRFYSSNNNMQQILPIIQGKSDVSLRLLDWFVTNYSKKYSTIITKADPTNNVVHFNVYLSYRSQLKAYSKQNFDPFRRRERIKFYYQKDKVVETTIGQLNFFRWIIQNNILEYVQSHIKDIEEDMINTQKVATIPAVQKKRLELSQSKLKNMNMFEGKRTISFA
jgi:hypothetical protein